MNRASLTAFMGAGLIAKSSVNAICTAPFSIILASITFLVVRAVQL
jgi:hypothetical protein